MLVEIYNMQQLVWINFQAFVDSVDAKEHITEVLDKEQATRAGDGFCAAVSLKDGKSNKI